MNSDKVFYVIVTVITIVLFGGIILVASKPKTTTQSNETANQVIPLEEIIGTSPNTNLPTDKAKVVVVEVSDFECPACKSMWATVNKIIADYGTEVSVVYRQFPLTSIHNYAYNAAKASEAAGIQGKFFDYQDILFRNQTDNSNPLKEEDFISFATELNLDIEKFKQDYSSDAVKAQVDEDIKYANSLGVNSTPTFYIDGKKIDHSKISLYDEVKRLVMEKNIQVEVNGEPAQVDVESGESK